MADNVTHYDAVEAYCGQLSYLAGDVIDVHVSCATDAFDIEVCRWGGPVLWQADRVPGVWHETPEDADAFGCNWPVSVRIPTDRTWTTGFYLVTMRAHYADEERAVGYAAFVIRPDARHGVHRLLRSRRADILLVLATNTYNAYNNWGGCSLYTGGHRVSFRRPFGRGMLLREPTERDDRKSRPAYRGEEPDIDGQVYQRYRAERGYPAYIGSAGWFTYERRFVEWAEANDIAIDYAVSSDLDRHPDITDGYSLVLSVGHDEYWSAPQRAAIERHVQRGGNFASFSGNTMFWQVRLEDGGANMVCHKYAAHRDDPVMGTDQQHTMTGMWCDPVVGRPETNLLGAGSAWGLYSRFGQATPRASGAFTVYRDDHWILRDTGLRYGDLLGAHDAVVGYEAVGCRIAFDDYQLPVAAGGDGTPDDIEIVAFTPVSNLAMGEYPKSIAALNDQGDLEFVTERLHGALTDDTLARHRIGNAVIVACRPFGPQAGEVVTVGTTDWVFGLNDPIVVQVTRNVMSRLSH